MEIYAEISSKMARDIEGGKIFPIPNGVEVQKIGLRGYIFNCDDNNKEDLIDMLEAKGVSWQDNKNEEEIRKEARAEKQRIKEDKKKAIAIYYKLINQSSDGQYR